MVETTVQSLAKSDSNKGGKKIMYTAPDFIKVEVNVKNTFAGLSNRCGYDHDYHHVDQHDGSICTTHTSSFEELFGDNCITSHDA